ncbi:glycosyltransferase [Sediminicoccus sp. KRV36]|uniref:glycosyltransferase n=1 Tax=Sediminicoccus sp. KRV36 TaxID=3133721 RepID=UPI00200F7108|nr:glycosyltransferase [Sediminicoccus rosea]UPY37432.1 glycosyltransferase [Sediminicoccus rosea]
MTGTARRRVLHVIPSLEQGGAERLLASLIEAASPDIQHRVVVLFDRVFFRPPGAEILSLNLPGRVGPRLALALPGALRRLRRIQRDWQPDLVQGWLYYGNLLAAMARSPGTPVLWSIHNTSFAPGLGALKLRLVDQICARWLGHVPARVIYCADSARRLHEARGYAPDRSVTILNGIETTRFRDDPALRAVGRARLGLDPRAWVIGHFARFDAQKNFPLVLEAIARARPALPPIAVVMAGRGVADAPALAGLVARHGLADVVRLLPPLDHMEEILPAMDLVLLGSGHGEALPMIAIEALASGRRLVATAVGDVPALGLPAEALVAPGDVAGFATAIVAVANSDALTWRELGADTRARFDLGRCVAAHEALWRQPALGAAASVGGALGAPVGMDMS